MDRSFTPPPDTIRAVKMPWPEPNEPETDLPQCQNCNRVHR
jgi:hypothetical protein